MNNNRLAYLLLILTALFWAGNAIAGKLALGHISPMLLTAGRWLFAAAIMIAIGWRHLATDWPLIRRHWVLLTLLGAFGFTVFNVSFYTAFFYTTAINVSVEQAGMPMLIFLLNFLVFRHSATRFQVIGLAMTIIGIVLTATHGELSRILTLDLNVGDAIMLGACVVYAGYSVALRSKPAIHWMSMMIALTVSAFLTAVPFAAWEIASDNAIYPDLRGWLILLYVLIGPSLLSQAMFIRGVELIGANRAGLFINLVPIFGTIMAIVLLGEAFHAYHAIALALVFGGIWLAEKQNAASQGQVR